MNESEVVLRKCCITYNQEIFIPQALNGFLIQEVSFPIEIIIYDDCSTDNTRALLLEFKKISKFPVKLLLSDENKFSKGERIFAKTFKEAKGIYIALCEADDYWTDSLKLQKQVDFLKANLDYSICFHNVSIYNELEKKIIKNNITRQVNETTSILDLAKGNYIHTPSVVLRNDFTIPEWYTDVALGDWCLYMISVNDRKIKKIDYIMAVYRIHKTSMWSSKTKRTRISKTLKSIRLIRKNVDKLDNETIKILDNSIKKLSKESMFNLCYWIKKIKY